MLTYIARRTLFMIPTLIAVSLVVFFLILLPPGDFLTTYMARLESRGADVESIRQSVDRLRARYGADKPFLQRYWKWITGIIFRGDFGDSFLYFGSSVSSLLISRLGATLLIAFSTLLFSWLIAIPIGIYSATHKYSFTDYFFTFLAFIGRSIPPFFLALLFLTAAVFIFDISPGGLFSPEYVDAGWSYMKFIDLLKHLWIPMIVIGMSRTASIMRVMRGNLLDVLDLQYIQTARSKGLSETIVIYKHAVRNALHPLVMMLGMQIRRIITGATVVSVVLSLPTISPLLLQALYSQDMYLAGAILLIQVVLLLVGNLIADIILAWLDPRIQYS